MALLDTFDTVLDPTFSTLQALLKQFSDQWESRVVTQVPTIAEIVDDGDREAALVAEESNVLGFDLEPLAEPAEVRARFVTQATRLRARAVAALRSRVQSRRARLTDARDRALERGLVCLRAAKAAHDADATDPSWAALVLVGAARIRDITHLLPAGWLTTLPASDQTLVSQANTLVSNRLARLGVIASLCDLDAIPLGDGTSVQATEIMSAYYRLRG